MSTLKTLSAKEFYWSILSGGKKLIEHQEEINKINVFPVPDADTGSNMAATVSSVIYNAREEGNIKEVAESIGNAALDGARGNSGVIFAQFLYALGQEMKEQATINTKNFSEIVTKASEYVYEAVPNPQEGTILSVIREWAAAISEHTHLEDFEDLFMKAELKAQKALEHTARQLEALKLAKVVDAGAKGFVVFIEGMKEALKRRAFAREDHNMEHLLSIESDLPVAEAELLTEDSLHNRYCTETCLIGEDIDKKAVLAILEANSDSIVTAGNHKKLRLHFHTNYPELLMGQLRKFGSFSFQKVEDMRLQYNVTHHRKNKIALIIDSGMAAGASFLEQEQIHVVPFTIEFSDGVYLDARTVTTSELVKRIAENNDQGKTSQPSPKAFADVYAYVSRYYDSAIVITTSEKVSGSHNSARQAVKMAKLPEGFRIDVLDSCSLSAGGGAVVQAIAREMQKGLSHDEIIEKVNKIAQSTEAYVNFLGIDHMIRSGRLGPYVGHILRFFKLSPMIIFVEKKPKVAAAGLGFENSLKKSLKMIKKHLAEGRKPLGFVVSHLVTPEFNQEQLQTYVDRVSRLLGLEPWSVDLASPAMAPNVGMGAIAVGVVYKN